jgi:hypothetical protein
MRTFFVLFVPTTLFQTGYIAPVGVTIFDFRLFWGSDILGHNWPTFFSGQYPPTFIYYFTGPQFPTF